MKKFTFCLLIALLFICACEAQFKNETLQVEIPTVTDTSISTANQCSINFTPMLHILARSGQRILQHPGNESCSIRPANPEASGQ